MYDIIDRETHDYLKKDCTLIHIIQAGESLIDDEVEKYFGVTEGHKYFKSLHRPARVKRYVFDKCVVPDNSRFIIKKSCKEI